MKATPAGVIRLMDSAAESAVEEDRERITALVRLVFGSTRDAEQLIRWIVDDAEVIDGEVVS